jgi:hypothetical protein
METFHGDGAGPDVGWLTPEQVIRLWTRVTNRVVKYGFAIEYADLEYPRSGTFDGLRIVLDPDVNFEMQCFLVLHLFGHSVQWVAPSYEPEVKNLPRGGSEQFLRALKQYEYNAARFGLQLMYEADVTDLDQWFADFVATDWKYVEAFYLGGVIPDWQVCIVRGAERIKPLPIPPLEHHKVEVRYAF